MQPKNKTTVMSTKTPDIPHETIQSEPSTLQTGNPITRDVYYPEKPKDYKEPSASRGFFITLRPHHDNKFSNQQEEQQKLTTYIQTLAGFKYAIIGREKNYYKNYASNSPNEPTHDDYMIEEDGYHYHIIARTENMSRPSKKKTIINDLVKLFPDNLFTDHSIDVKFLDPKERNAIGYVCKDNDYMTVGDITTEYIENTRKLYDKEKKQKEKTKKIKFKTAKEREEAMTKFIVDLMNDNKIKINYYTGKFMNIDNEFEFWELVTKNGFLEIFSYKDLEFMQRIIKNTTLFSSLFPCYRPDLTIFKYSDCYLDLKNSKIMTLEEGKKFLDDEKRDPVLEFDVPFTRNVPQLYREYVSRFADPEQFRKVFREVLLPVVRGGKCLYMYGPSGTGKSVMYEVFKYIFRNVMNDHADDNGFTWSNIAPCPKFAIDECNLFDRTTSLERQNQYKKLLNGDEFAVSVKGKPPIQSIPKNGIMTSNTTPYPKRLTSEEKKHNEALIGRVYIEYVYKSVEERDLQYTIKMFEEVPEIISYHMEPF